MAKEIYIFSGLGADERVFQRLDLSGFSPKFIKWIVPKDRESITEYATRILEQINSANPLLMGLSFGGIVAVEVAKQIKVEKVVLISSAKTKHEIPFYFRLAGKLFLHKLLPTKLLKSSNFMTYWFFGAGSNYDKRLLKQILLDTDPVFLRWAIDVVVRWKNECIPKNAFHIHGTSDRILPIRFIDCDLAIKRGGHFMVLNKSKEISSILDNRL